MFNNSLKDKEFNEISNCEWQRAEVDNDMVFPKPNRKSKPGFVIKHPPL